ncbi:MAG: glutaredoxin domain-containing protein [Patescibacteria group bacterium]
MHKVTIYTTPTCAYCKMAKEFFKQNNINYEEKNVLTDLKAREDMIHKSGQMGVPVIDVDGSLIVGFDRRRLAELLGIK